MFLDIVSPILVVSKDKNFKTGKICFMKTKIRGEATDEQIFFLQMVYLPELAHLDSFWTLFHG